MHGSKEEEMGRKPPRPLGTDWFVGPDWKALLREYQEASNSATSSVLLDALEPGVSWCLETMPSATAVNDICDMRQQLLLELLEAAAVLGPDTPTEWIPVCLLEQARRKVFRWLHRQGWLETEPIHPLLPAPGDLETDVLHRLNHVATDGHLYRKAIHGERFVEQARDLGVLPATVRKRASRERQRLRRRLRASQ